MREGRAFGLGVVIASQFPRDLPEAVRGSTATPLYFSQGQVEQIREIQRTIVGKTSGPEAEHVASVVRGLTPLSCVMHSTKIQTLRAGCRHALFSVSGVRREHLSRWLELP